MRGFLKTQLQGDLFDGLRCMNQQTFGFQQQAVSDDGFGRQSALGKAEHPQRFFAARQLSRIKTDLVLHRKMLFQQSVELLPTQVLFIFRLHVLRVERNQQREKSL